MKRWIAIGAGVGVLLAVLLALAVAGRLMDVLEFLLP